MVAADNIRESISHAVQVVFHLDVRRTGDAEHGAGPRDMLSLGKVDDDRLSQCTRWRVFGRSTFARVKRRMELKPHVLAGLLPSVEGRRHSVTCCMRHHYHLTICPRSSSILAAHSLYACSVSPECNKRVQHCDLEPRRSSTLSSGFSSHMASPLRCKLKGLLFRMLRRRPALRVRKGVMDGRAKVLRTTKRSIADIVEPIPAELRLEVMVMVWCRNDSL